MKAGPVQRVKAERVEDRGAVVIPTLWRELGPLEVATPPAGGPLSRGEEGPILSHPAPPWVLVLCAAGSLPSAALADLAARAERTYVLSEPGWQPGQDLLRAIRGPRPRLLVRHVSPVPATAVLTPSEGWLWLGPEPGAGSPLPWRLTLDEPQRQALRHLFLTLFWSEATSELWPEGDALRSHAPSRAPFPLPAEAPGSPVTLLPAGASLSVPPSCAAALLRTFTPPTYPAKRLWLFRSGHNHAALSSLARQGAEIVSGDPGLPELALTEEGGQLLLPGKSKRLRLTVNPAQASALRQVLESTPSWCFEREVPLSRLATLAPGAPLWLSDAPGPQPLQPEQVLEEGEVLASSLRELSEAAPASWKPHAPLALKARHTWVCVPPRVPASAKEDPLLTNWARLDAEFATRLKALDEAVRATETHQSTLGKRFSRLVSDLLGFKREQSALQGRLTRLGAPPPSRLGPDQARASALELVALEEEVNKLRDDLKAAEWKAAEDQAREEQQERWQQDHTRARQEAERIREEKVKAASRLEELERGLKALENAPDGEDDAGRKDREARLKRDRDERNRLKETSSSLAARLKSCEETLSRPFEFKPPPAPLVSSAQGGKSFVPRPQGPSRQPPQVPGEALPGVGHLRRHNDKRYLVIERWEQLDEAEAEARRLNATLVAGEDV